MPLLRLLSKSFSPNLKHVGPFTVEHFPFLCPWGKCIPNIEQDICVLPAFSEAVLRPLLRYATAAFHVASDPIQVSDAVTQRIVQQVMSESSSATHYVYLTKGVLLGRTELVDSLGSHALAGMAPATAVWAELHDTYGVVEANDFPHQLQEQLSIVDRLAFKAISLHDTELWVPERRYLDCVHREDVVAAFRELARLPPGRLVARIGSGELASIHLVKATIADLSWRCLNRTVWPHGPSSFTAEEWLDIAARNISQRAPATWRPRRTPMPLIAGVLSTMLRLLKDLGLKQASHTPDAAACLRRAARSARSASQEVGHRVPLEAQMGHPLICQFPNPDPQQFQPPPNHNPKVLVVVTGMLRSYHSTWHSFQGHVKNPHNLEGEVDLALAVSQIPSTARSDQEDHFYQHAKFIWEVLEPPGGNYRHYFTEVAEVCYGREFSVADAVAIGRATWPGNFMGRIKESGHRFASATGLFFRWVALQQMLWLGLLSEYRAIILTRSDFLWVAPHPPVTAIRPGEVLVPGGTSDWGGLYDRHMALHPADAPRCLFQFEPLVNQSGAAAVHFFRATELIVSPPPRFGYNGEVYLRWWLTRRGFRVRRFPPSQFLVIDGRRPKGVRRKRMVTVGAVVVPKYPDEYRSALPNQRPVRCC
eukprot:EG_transcript_4031